MPQALGCQLEEHESVQDVADDDEIQHRPDQEHAEGNEEPRLAPGRHLADDQAVMTETDCVATVATSQVPLIPFSRLGFWG
jgi:hypothetical protein